MPVRFVLSGRVFSTSGFLFDKDGTLISFDHWRAVMRERARRLALRLNLTEAQQRGLMQLMGASPENDPGGSWGVIPLPRCDAEQAVAEHLATALRQDLSELGPLVAAAFHDVDGDFPFEKHLCPTAGAEASLRAIRRGGGRTAIVTHDIESAARHHLAALGWTDLVDALIGLDGCGERKPSPQPIFAACRALDLPPRETVMIGDTVTDLLAGRAAGCGLTIGLLTGLGTKDELTPHADWVVPDLTTLALGLTA